MPLLDHGATSPLVLAYGLTCTILCLNLLGLWVASGAARARSGVAVNPEDATRYGATRADLDPPLVARILRAHRNAEALIYPFLLLGLVYVLVGGSGGLALALFGLFVVARLAHTVAYLSAKQPWRSISFAASLLITAVLLASDAWIVFARWRGLT